MPGDFAQVTGVLPAHVALTTQQWYMEAAIRFGHHLQDRGKTFAGADTDDCQAFLDTGVSPALAEAVVNVSCRLQAAGFRDDNPWLPLMNRVMRPTVDARPPVHVDAVLRAARPGREHVAVVLLGQVGLRLGEAANLRFQDVYLEDPEPHLTIQSQVRAVPPEAVAPLAAHIAQMAPEPEDLVLGWSRNHLGTVIRAVGHRAGFILTGHELRSAFIHQLRLRHAAD